MTAPGFARPTSDPVGDFDWMSIGRRNRPGPGSVFEWRPVGGYVEAGINWTWGLTPGTFAFELPASNPLNDAIRQNDIDKQIYQFDAGYKGLPFTGRVMQRQQVGAPGREKFLYSGVCNKKWLQRGYGWVNNWFPPEVQIGLTGKQDIDFGFPDPLMKRYVTKVFTRLDKPVWSSLPVRRPDLTMPDLKDIDSLDDLLDLLFDFGEDLVAMMARFTQLDELFAGPVDRLELGITMDAWDGRGTPPQVINANGIAALQQIFDLNGDHFLDLSLLLRPLNNGLYQLTPDRAGYVFGTKEKRDNRKTMFRTDGDQIASYDMQVMANEATRAIVGGKSPSMVNSLIEIGANLALAAIIAAIATIPGAGGIGGLTVGIGDLFDDVFFAYEVHVDLEAEALLGEDAFPEKFADNTAAHTVDSYAVSKTALHDLAGRKTIAITPSANSGIGFGIDDGTARRFQVGDILSFWDRGNIVERYVDGVSVTSKPGELMREAVSLGTDKRAKGPWTRAITGIQGLGATSRGIANST